MALVCMLFKMLCVVILLISSLSSVSSSPDSFLYDTHLSFDNSPDIFLYQSLHDNIPRVLHKRQVGDASNISSTASTSTEEVNIASSSASPPGESNTEKPDPKILLNKNLGVNGTGIRRNITKEVSDGVKLLNLTSEFTTASNPNATDIRVLTTNQTKNLDDEEELTLSSFSEDVIKKVEAQNHINRTYDHHQYYNSTLTVDPIQGHKYWVNMANNSDTKVSDLLSQSHRRAATVRLSFDFPFYGHIVRNITIATGGFLYTGEYVHSWLAATQYIAPLMANFDTSLSNDSYIKYLDNGTAFTVQWEKVALQDKPNDGNFTFQTTLHKNGDIVFVYETIPITIEDIQDDHHPVKIGLSDAYISDRTIFFVRRKTIYEYHRVNFNRGDIHNWTVIYLKALPTCLSNKDCVSCVSKPTDNFQCSWCPGINRCSSGMDRHRHGWLMRGCELKKVTSETQCAAAATDVSGIDLANGTDFIDDNHVSHYNTDGTSAGAAAGSGATIGGRAAMDEPRQEPQVTQSAQSPMGVSGIIMILAIICFVVGLGVWLMYAYRNPHSTSGQMLIRYRPSQWSWKRGEARYTAATIHM